MAQGFLLGRALLRFDHGTDDRDPDDLLGELSAAAFSPDGSLWLGADEGRLIERLQPLAPAVYGNHRTFVAADFVTLFNREDEIDIEAMEYHEGYLWVAGSHSSKRKKPKGKKTEKDLERLATVVDEPNRHLLARIPVHNGEAFRVLDHPDGTERSLSAARLAEHDDSNLLLPALAEDPHLGPFVRANIPSKDNGLDIEGLAVLDERVWLGLRGPVLRGHAVVLELAPRLGKDGDLHLEPLDERPFRKHFLQLQGLGIRDMCRCGDDLLLLAGPTMALEGFLRVYRWRGAAELAGDSISSSDDTQLEALFELPFSIGNDRAEGLALTRYLDEPALLVVYDDPAPERRAADHAVLMDLYRLPQ